MKKFICRSEYFQQINFTEVALFLFLHSHENPQTFTAVLNAGQKYEESAIFTFSLFLQHPIEQIQIIL
jgi:hypothetical protein